MYLGKHPKQKLLKASKRVRTRRRITLRKKGKPTSEGLTVYTRSSIHYYVYNPKDGSVSRNEWVVDDASRFDKSRSWTRTPNYAKTRYLPENEYYYSRSTVTNHSGYIRSAKKTGDQVFVVEGLLNLFADVGSFLPIDSTQSSLQARVSTALLLDLKDSKVNLAQAFAERKQTADLLATTAMRFVDVLTLLKQGKFRAAAAVLSVSTSRSQRSRYGRAWANSPENAVASGWLELQYGWKPLLDDVYGSAQLIAQKKMRELRTVSRQRKKVVQSCDTVVKNSTKGVTYYQKQRTSHTVKMQVEYATNEVSHTLAQVGVSNPALLMWELLPYSFVVDWFIPIGNFISSIDATNGLSFVKGSITTCTDYEYDVVVTGNQLRSGWDVSGYGTACGKKVVISRIALTGFPSVAAPRFKNPLSYEHVSNAIALLSTAFKR